MKEKYRVIIGRVLRKKGLISWIMMLKLGLDEFSSVRSGGEGGEDVSSRDNSLSKGRPALGRRLEGRKVLLSCEEWQKGQRGWRVRGGEGDNLEKWVGPR